MDEGEAAEWAARHKQAMEAINGVLPGDSDHPGAGTGGIRDPSHELTEEEVAYGRELHRTYTDQLAHRDNQQHVELQRKIDLRSYAVAALPSKLLRGQAKNPHYVSQTQRVPATWTPPRDLSLRLRPHGAVLHDRYEPPRWYKGRHSWSKKYRGTAVGKKVWDKATEKEYERLRKKAEADAKESARF